MRTLFSLKPLLLVLARVFRRPWWLNRGVPHGRHLNTVADQISNEALDTAGWEGLKMPEVRNVSFLQNAY